MFVVDAHTAHHLYYECLKGDLMRGRTVILVSHHVQLCAPGASYIVALDNGRVQFQGGREAFQSSTVLRSLSQSTAEPVDGEDETPVIEDLAPEKKGNGDTSETSSTTVPAPPEPEIKVEKKPPRKLIEEEKRAVGRISKELWLTYIKACGGVVYWTSFVFILVLAALTPVMENGWLKYVNPLLYQGDALNQSSEFGLVPRWKVLLPIALSSISAFMQVYVLSCLDYSRVLLTPPKRLLP